MSIRRLDLGSTAPSGLLGRGRTGRRPRAVVWGLWALVAALAGAVAGIAVAAAIHVPRVESVADFTPSLITQFEDARGEVFASYARERRILLREGELPELLQHAIIAAEDSNFFRHGGIDAEGVLRAVMRNLAQGEIVLGGSTITMQLARQLFLTREKTWRRKVEEAFLSVQLEKELSKQQILTLYCNVVFLGHGAYGMAAAARYYFDRAVGELSLPEAATLAGIIQQPSRLSPYRNPRLVVERRNYVLRRMSEEGFIDDGQYQAAVAAPLVVVRHQATSQLGAYFAEEIRRDLESRYGTQTVLEKGLQVQTTLDPAIQRAAEDALRAGLARLDHRRGWRGPVRRLDEDAFATGELDTWRSRELQPGTWSQGIVLASAAGSARVKIGDSVYELTGRGIAWTGRSSPQEVLAARDVAWFRLEQPDDGGDPYLVLEQEPQLEGAVLVIESSTGAVRALVGGWDFERSKFDRAIQARRQVGSAFKPFVYGAALEMGFTAADTLFDAPAVFAGTDAQASYSPRNYYRRYYGIITLRFALEHSVNVTSVKLLSMVGVDRVIDLARRLGVTSDLPPYPSLALGSADLSPIELAAAYAAIANQGLYVEPYLVERVSYPDGRVLSEHLLRAQQAMEPNVAYVLSHILEGTIDRGTGVRLADLDIDLAGKTGTTDAYTDAWFVGFTPRYTLLTWVGHDIKRPIGRNMTGAEAALPIWRQIVERGLAEGWLTAGERFVPPPGVTLEPIDYASGLLPGPGAGPLIDEAFVEGTGPSLRFEPRWNRILSLPWFQQRPFYLPKEGEPMPDDIRDWNLVQRAWEAED